MKKVLACIVALVALVSVVSASAHAENNTNVWYWLNGGCLGEPYTRIWWPPIDPEGDNCTLSSRNAELPFATYMSSSEACPTTPDSPWTVISSVDEPTCNTTSSQFTYATQRCVPFINQKRGGYDNSYFLSCLDDPPTNPFVRLEQVASCGTTAPAPTSIARDEQAGASVPLLSAGIFANAPGTCAPYYNNSDPSPFGSYANYVKISAVCDPIYTETLDITFYNDSACTHVAFSASFNMGCTVVPEMNNHPIQLTCVGSNPPSSTPTASPTAPTATPTGSASPLSLSIALVAFLASTLAVFML